MTGCRTSADFELTADRLGLTIVAATAAGFAAHGVGKAVQHRVGTARDTRASRAAAALEVDMSGGDGDRPPGGSDGERDGR